MNIVVTNMSRVEQGIDEALRAYNEYIVRACLEATRKTAADVMDEARGDTPVETGHLVRSAKTSDPVRERDSATTEVGYTAEYAAHVHENMEGRRPKFLERAVISVGPRLRHTVVKEIRR